MSEYTEERVKWVRRSKFSGPFLKRKRIHSRANQNTVRDRKKCENCFTRKGPFEVHHIKHRSLGGDDALENLSCLCVECHRGHHDGRIKLRLSLLSMEQEAGYNLEVKDGGIRISKEFR